MNQHAIIYLHGFNSASLDREGKLLTSKAKLTILQEFCTQNAVVLHAPNVDYRDFENLVADSLLTWNQLLDLGYQVTFMGSSMGGFSSEYLALKTGCPAIMINPAISPSSLLPYFLGTNTNPDTGLVYAWELAHCQQYLPFEQEIRDNFLTIQRMLLLDRADELLDTANTIAKYQASSEIVAFDGGSHAFEHMQEALAHIAPVILR